MPKGLTTGCKPLACDICFRPKLPIVILNGPLILMNVVFSNVTERPFVTGNTYDPPETGTNCRAQDLMPRAQQQLD